MTALSSSLRERMPRGVKNVVKVVIETAGAATSGVRMMPSYLIIGAQRCGTTSLYEYLIQHPSVGASSTKEVHYFDTSFDRGLNWYRGHFPMRVTQKMAERRSGTSFITGEASPYYLFHPHAAKRAAELLPNARLIVMLRDPVERAYSHYQHEVGLRYETLEFEEALDREETRLKGEVERMLEEPLYNSFAHQHFTYLARGRYADQLRSWFDVFPRERVLVLKSEDFFADPSTTLDRAQDFLDLARMRLPAYSKHNARTYADMDSRTRQRLVDHYATPNEELSTLLGPDFRW